MQTQIKHNWLVLLCSEQLESNSHDTHLNSSCSQYLNERISLCCTNIPTHLLQPDSEDAAFRSSAAVFDVEWTITAFRHSAQSHSLDKYWQVSD